MSRLTHSSGGFVRSLQMSSIKVFAFVEGRLDRPFFDRLLARECSPRQVGHRVIAMKELPGGTGGKPALLATFKDFRKRGLLACTAFGKSMVCIFMADKDADDFTKRRLRSPHLLYSPTYDLEGHLFTCGDLARALSDACGITADQAKHLIPDPKNWLQNAAKYWKDWIALCLISQANCLNCGCTFDRTSQVNPNPFAPPNPSQVATFKTSISQKLGISQTSFEVHFQTAMNAIEKSINTDNPLKYFKGKWLSHLIQRYLESKPRIPDAQISSVGDRMGISLLSQVAMGSNCKFSIAYNAPLRSIVEKL